MLCHAMPCHAMPCHAVLCHAVPCCVLPCHALSCRVMPLGIPSCHHVTGVDKLISDPRYELFRSPVPLDIYPDYATVVAHPIDLSSIREKLDRGTRKVGWVGETPPSVSNQYTVCLLICSFACLRACVCTCVRARLLVCVPRIVVPCRDLGVFVCLGEYSRAEQLRPEFELLRQNCAAFNQVGRWIDR